MMELSILLSLVATIVSVVTVVKTLYEKLSINRRLMQAIDDLLNLPFSRALLEKPDMPQNVEYFKDLVRASSSAAVLASWREIEEAIKDKLAEHEPDFEKLALSEEVKSTLRQLWRLRNEIAHSPSIKLDDERALKIVEMSTELASTIKQ